MSQIKPLFYSTFPCAYWKLVVDSKTGKEEPGVGANYICRFRSRVKLHQMRLSISPVIWDENVHEDGVLPNRPATVTIEGYTSAEPQGSILFSGLLSWTEGETTVDLGGVEVLAVSIRCHETLPAKEIFSDVTSLSSRGVSFTIFKGIEWLGNECPVADSAPVPEPPAEFTPLQKGTIQPSGTSEIKAWDDGMFVHYESAYLKLSFSTIRPRIAHLSWDALASGLTSKNLILEHKNDRGPIWSSGPWDYDLAGVCPPYIWGGEVKVEGLRVTYRNIHCGDSSTMDIVFTIEADGFQMDINRTCHKGRGLLESAAWRMVWNGQGNGSISTFAIPERGEHRNGYVATTGGVHATGHGVLKFATVAGKEHTKIQTESFGFALPINETFFQVGCQPNPEGTITTLPGTYHTAIRFTVDNIKPELCDGVTEDMVHPGLKKFWPTVFGFRPEAGGFSNNAFAINATNCVHLPADVAVYEKITPGMPAMLDLLEYTLEMALRCGSGYKCDWTQDTYHDTAPALVIAIGRVFQRRPQSEWIRRMWSYIVGPIKRILSKLDTEGRYICQTATGNRGAYGHSPTAWDAIGMGHHIAMASAMAYRALKAATTMSLAMDDKELADQCRDAADRLAPATVKDLHNPGTGWLADWRSADGELHDHACLFSNGMIALFGMMEDDQAKEVLGALEKERVRCEHTDFRYGLAAQLWPIRQDENIAWYDAQACPFWDVYRSRREDGADTMGLFINGCLMPDFTEFYLSALAKYGFTDTADAICDQLLDSFDKHVFEGSRTGTEFFTRDGMVTGYEGTLVHGYAVLTAIGLHKGWIKPLASAWWPE